MELSMNDLRSLLAPSNHLADKDYGNIVLILRNGFVFCGVTRRVSGVGYLRGSQVRYWKQRDGGLPEFAAKGPIDGDKLDKVHGEFEFPWSEYNVLGVLQCNWTPRD